MSGLLDYARSEVRELCQRGLPELRGKVRASQRPGGSTARRCSLNLSIHEFPAWLRAYLSTRFLSQEVNTDVFEERAGLVHFLLEVFPCELGSGLSFALLHDLINLKLTL